MIKIDNLKQPPILGKTYLVPCIVYTEKSIIEEDEDWLDLEPYPLNMTKEIISKIEIPIINHKHNDRENRQKEEHYHIDNRFNCNTTSRTRINLPLKKNEKIQYLLKECIDDTFRYGTPIELIRKSKLKHKCIYKGKCPHRGMDLSQVQPKLNINTQEWEIICPLHSLRFDASSKKLINDR